jgi:hypothetical protein
MGKASEALQRKGEALAYLRKVLKPGMTVYTTLRSVARSGMSRRLDVQAVIDGKIEWLTGRVAALGIGSYTLEDWKHSRGMSIGGCGSDAGFDTVYNLSHELWPGGNGKYVTGRNGDKKPETDGGYLLNHKWI